MSVAVIPADITTPTTRRGYSTAWWGMVVLITTEAMVFLALLASYFFLRAGSARWPPAGIAPPELHRSGVFSVVLERRPEGWRIVPDHTSSEAS